MPDPIQNFDDWSENIFKIADDVEILGGYFDQFQNILNYICINGQIPQNSNCTTFQFLDDMERKIIKPILYYDSLDDSKAQIITNYLQLFLSFSLVGFKICDKQISKLSLTILQDETKPFFSQISRKYSYRSICRYMAHQDSQSIIYDFIRFKCDGCEAISIALQLISHIYPFFSDSYDPEELMQITLATLNRIISKYGSSSNFDLSSFILAIDYLKTCIPKEKNYLADLSEFVIPLLYPYFSSSIFSHRRAAFVAIKNFLNENGMKKIIINFFADRAHKERIDNIVKPDNFHVEYATAIGKIVSSIAKEGLLRRKTLMILWSKYTSLHVSEKGQFLDMIISIIESSNAKLLEPIMNEILKLNPYKVEWFFELISKLSPILSRHSSGAPWLSQLRHKLWSLSVNMESNEESTNFSQNSFSPEKITLLSRQELTHLLQFKADENAFTIITDYLFNLSQSSFENNQTSEVNHTNEEELRKTKIFCLDLMIALLQGKTQISKEIAQKILDKTIQVLQTNSEISPRETDMIVQLSIKTKSGLTEEQIEEISSFQPKCTCFFTFLDKLVQNEVLNDNGIDKIISKIDPAQFDNHFYLFFKHSIIKRNELMIKSLPISGEDLLWHFAIIDSPIRSKFSKLLSTLYSRNDGEKLTDHDMVHSFLDRWESLFVPVNKAFDSEVNISFLIDILSDFVSKIESESYYSYASDLSNAPHNFLDACSTINIMFTLEERPNEPAQTFSITRNSKIARVAEYIGNLLGRKFYLVQIFYNKTHLKNSIRISNIIPPEEHLFVISVKFDRTRHDVIKHSRNYFPSSGILERPWLSDLFNYLEIKLEGLEKAQESAHHLFKLLPAIPEEVSQGIRFPPDLPYIFYYSLTTITISLYTHSIPLISSIKSHHFSSTIIESLSNLLTYVSSENIQQIYLEIFELASSLLVYLFPYIGPKKLEQSSIDVISNEIEIINPTDFKQEQISDQKKIDDSELSKVENKEVNETLEEKNNEQEQLFFLMIQLVQTIQNINQQNQIQNVIQTVKKLISGYQMNIQFQEKLFPIFKEDIFSSNYTLREFARLSFGKVLVPIDVYLSILTEGNLVQYTNEFILSILDHLSTFGLSTILNSPIPEISIQLLQKSLNTFSITKDSNYTFHLLELSSNLLTLNVYNKEQQIQLLTLLIGNFLTYDFDEGLRGCFSNASKILSSLWNIKSKEEDEYPILYQSLQLHHQNRPVFSQFYINGDDVNISVCNRVGLKNQGNTCYLNATLQQLFNIIPLRNNLMNHYIDISNQDKPSLDLLNDDQRFLVMLGKLFVQLNFRKQKCCTTQEFTSNWKIYGEDFNPRIQQDAIEYLQLILETVGLQDNISSSLFGGKILHVYSSTDSSLQLRREVIEDFKTFDLEVERCSGLLESLDNFLKPDYFVGGNQYCFDDGIKADTVKCSTILNAPPILIFHLKRFSYDFVKGIRNKVKSYFELPDEFDISPYCSPGTQYSLYHLKGIIMHKGSSAISGHYISYIKSEDGNWMLFDDEKVTPVFESEVLTSATGSQKDLSAYIAFYERNHNQKCDAKPLNDEILNEISIANNETRFQGLLCSKGYFELMTNLMKLPNPLYTPIAAQYVINTLPFISPWKNANISDFTNNLQSKLKISPDGRKYIFNLLLHFPDAPENIGGYLETVIFRCSNDIIRESIADCIAFAILNSEPDDPILLEIAKSTFNIVDILITDYTQIDETFHILNQLYKHCPSVQQFAIESNWKKRMTDFISIDLNKLYEEKKNLKRSYIISGLNFTYYLRFISNLKIPDSLNGSLKSESFLISIFETTKTESHATAKFLKTYFSSNNFITFVKANSSQFELINILSVIISTIPEKALDLILQTKFKFGSRLSTLSDSLAAFVIILSQERPNSPLPKILVQTCNQWIPKLLLDGDEDVRQNTLSLITYLIPHESLLEYSPIENLPNDLNSNFDDISQEDPQIRPKDQKMIDDSLTILSAVFKIQTEISKKSEKNSSIASQWLIIVEKLLDIINQIPPVEVANITLLAKMYINLSIHHPFSKIALEFLKVIVKFRIHMDVLDILKPFEIVTKKLKAKQLPDICNFLPFIVKAIGKRSLTNDFISLFVSQKIMFIKFRDLTKENMINLMMFTRYLAENYKGILVEIVKNDYIKFAQQNFQLCLYLMYLLHIKGNLVQFLPKGLDKKEASFMKQEEIIKKTLYLNLIEKEDQQIIEKKVLESYQQTLDRNSIVMLKNYAKRANELIVT